jgi:excinuclease ABC subunit A
VARKQPDVFPPDAITVTGASEHNLQGVDVRIPRGTLAVVTGVSGSGKSSLVFDTICAEGRRRFLETFSSYARQFLGRLSRPAVSRISGLSPAVAVDQAAGVRHPRSTVGTLTEIYDVLRLVWARAGSAPAGQPGPPIARQLFSFNAPEGACPACKGLGVDDRLDPDLLVADPSKSLRGGALRITTPTGYLIYSQVTIDVLDTVCQAHGFTVDLPWRDLTPNQRDVVLNGSDRIRIPYGKHPLASRMKWTGITAQPREEGVYKGILPVMEQILRQKRNGNILRFVRTLPCRACGGTRLRPEALAITVDGLSIADAARLSVDALARLFGGTDGSAAPWASDLSGRARDVVAAAGRHVLERCDVLQRLGLGHLSLDRDSTTLSSGEVQRLRVARQAGIALQGVLYVFDEPSIGLHHRDTERLLEVLREIRDRGNTVLVVEHDEQAMRGADWIADIGPGPGAAGGRVLYAGPAGPFVSGHTAVPASRTQAVLTGREAVPVPAARRPGRGVLALRGVTRHNLRDVSVDVLLGAFNVITGVSGAGKSTLMSELRRLVQDGSGGPGRMTISERIGKIVDIDQSPIGRTPRSNPATYSGAFDIIRERFAAQPEAILRGYGKGRFSFNVPGGRCDACEGAGVVQVGMQFLGPAAVVCEACGGRRFSRETLEILLGGLNISETLALPIADARVFFSDVGSLARILDVLDALGLGYLPLGHPATLLSGGEAQRVKLAAELARPASAHTLYLLDEPTVGLHACDVAMLLAAVSGLVDRGHTVVAIEHDLDVIKSADRVIDLGPGSGDEGGRVVAVGSPEEVATSRASATGLALGRVLGGGSACVESNSARPPRPGDAVAAGVRFAGVSTHNLRGVDVTFPHRHLTVITGVSGSGKSSLAFDTLATEGRHRFAESFSSWSRRFVMRGSEASFDDVSGLTPVIAISQRAPSRNPRSTVATLTEIHDHYRVLFSRAGTRGCPRCAVALEAPSCARCGFQGTPTLTAAMFSPNSEAGACPSCEGLGVVMHCDPDRLITHPDRPLIDGAMAGHRPGRFYGDPRGQHMATLQAVGVALGMDFSVPWSRLDAGARTAALDGCGARVFEVDWSYQRGARSGTHHFAGPWPGLRALVRLEWLRKHGRARGDALDALMAQAPCDACAGARLKPEPRAVRFAGAGFAEVLAMTVEENRAFLADVEAGVRLVSPGVRALTADVRHELAARLDALADAGIGYLELDRPAATLSGGEAQRVRLASELRSGLTGITYVLDEPTAGLHPADTARLIAMMGHLRDAGNTVVVVEHDLDVIAAADHAIEVGPGAGLQGGRIVFAGFPQDLEAHRASVTGPYLRRWRTGAGQAREPRVLRAGFEVQGASLHNLAGIDVSIPAGGLVAITGVSGSGKSTLAFDVLGPSIRAALDAGRTPARPVGCRAMVLAEHMAQVVDVAAPLQGLSAWSMPATLVGAFDAMRDAFARSPDAVARRLPKAAFSTAGRGGRCERCEGLGVVRTRMDFLPDVWSVCDDCGGARYGAEALACRVGGRTIADVLDMTVDEALAMWRGTSGAERPLAALRDVGLGYLRVGQPASQLSGGERQRIALAQSLVDGGRGPSLFLFDEPTRGLHPADVERLAGVFDRLVDAGHSLVVVEHDLGLIRTADWVIDLGPGAGRDGGRVVVAGTPAQVAACSASRTGQALRGVRPTFPAVVR